MKTWNLIKRFAGDHRGMETVEWGIMAALIVTGLVAVIGLLGGQILNKFTALQTSTT